MKNLPEKIYLNFGDMTKDEFEKEDYNALTQQDEYAVTFSEDKVFDEMYSKNKNYLKGE